MSWKLRRYTKLRSGKAEPPKSRKDNLCLSDNPCALCSPINIADSGPGLSVGNLLVISNLLEKSN